MNEMKIFENPEFGKIRTFKLEEEPWFVGKDVAAALGYAKTENAIAAHVDAEDKTTTLIQGDGSNYKSMTTIINESGLYSLILSSKLPTAKRFKHWVTSEVLPSIRKNGGYIVNQNELSDSELMAKAIIVANRINEENRLKIEAQGKMLEEQKPFVDFAKCVSDKGGAVDIGVFAKTIHLGRNRLLKFMRDNKYLMKNNVPYQTYINYGYFRVVQVKYDFEYESTMGLEH